ncbi:hypothetical protein Taro_020548 [Colocasia esculenta]|nr:hypothetical protein [Colocasia esculenta]
MRGARN